MEISIDAFHIVHRDLLVQDHFVEGNDEKSIQESAMEDSKTNNAADETEVVEMLRVDARVRIDLQSVIVVSRIFEKATQSG